jgi:hypothetical protein
VTTDEIRLLQLYAAGQRGSADAVRAHLAWMLRPVHTAHPEIAVAHAAAILGRSGFHLPWRCEEAEPIARRAASRQPATYGERLRLCD